MALENFSDEYTYIKPLIRAGNFGAPLKEVMDGMKLLVTDDGFDGSYGKKLDLLRSVLSQREGERILQAVGIDATANTAPNSKLLMQAAAVKFMRHVYLIKERGAQKVWVFSCPKSYTHYPSDELWAAHSSITSVKTKLDDTSERFSKSQRAALGEASGTGLAWCHKVINALSKTNDKTKEKLRRWFGTAATPDTELDAIARTLLAGFKKVAATINSNHLIFTDMPSIRGATSGKEKGLLNAYAFVYSGRYEKLPIVYIEQAFFSRNTTPIGTRDLWALTVVHELTHLECSTKDHRYDFDGLEVGANLSAAQALDNADSWAYFCADVAGVLTRRQRTSALNGWA